MSFPFNLFWTVSYVGHDGITHYLTHDGSPPDLGSPTPPTYELLALSASPPAPPAPISLLEAPSSSPAPIPQLRATGYFAFQPVQQAAVTAPIEYVNINFIANGVRPYHDRFTGRSRDEEIIYTVCRAPTNMRMRDLILTFEGGGARGFTECKLLSDGRSWAKVQTYKLGDENSEKTLAALGWTASRGVDGPPVWVCAYHEGLDEREEQRYWEEHGFPAS